MNKTLVALVAAATLALPGCFLLPRSSNSVSQTQCSGEYVAGIDMPQRYSPSGQGWCPATTRYSGSARVVAESQRDGWCACGYD